VYEPTPNVISIADAAKRHAHPSKNPKEPTNPDNDGNNSMKVA